MTGIIASIQTRLDADCIARQCRKNGCSVSLVGTPQQRPIVDFDKPGSPLGPAAPRCDYLFLAESSCRELWIAPVELKKGPVDAGKAIPQLQAGAHAAERLVPADIAADILFRPVLAAGGMRKAKRNRNRAGRVKFHGYSKPLRRIRGGGSLIHAFRR